MSHYFKVGSCLAARQIAAIALVDISKSALSLMYRVNHQKTVLLESSWLHILNIASVRIDLSSGRPSGCCCLAARDGNKRPKTAKILNSSVYGTSFPPMQRTLFAPDKLPINALAREDASLVPNPCLQEASLDLNSKQNQQGTLCLAVTT